MYSNPRDKAGTEISKRYPLNTFERENANSIFSILLTGRQFKSLGRGIMCSNFLKPETTLATKFWTLCNLETFFFDVLDHTGEQEVKQARQEVMT